MNSSQPAAAQAKKAGGAKKKKKIVVKKKKKSGGKSKHEKKEADDTESVTKAADDSVERNDDSDGDYSDIDDEGADGYKPGGYHRVAIGDKFKSGRYTVVKKLGWGHFSTVWLVHDKTPRSEALRFVALKIQKSADHYREAAYDEIKLLNCVSDAAVSVASGRYSSDPCVVELLDHFEHIGQYGRHVCMIFEVLGENLLSLIKKYNYRGIPIGIVKNITRQMLVGLDFLHRKCQIIHTDLKPENILISTSTVIAPSGAELSAILNGECKDSKSEIDPKMLTADQKKKLKKKNKKKRQNAKKAGLISNEYLCDSTSTSLADQLQEMKLMESASEPMGYRTNAVSLLAQVKASNSISSVATSEAFPFDESLREPPIVHIDEGSVIWLQKALFTDINFNSNASTSGRRTSASSSGFTQKVEIRSLPFESWESPGEDFYSKLTMITSVRKVYSFFGEPVSDVVASFAAGDDPLHHEEYCHVLSNSDWLLELSSSGNRDRSLSFVDTGSACQFTVRGHGLDGDGIASLVSTCLFETMNSSFDIFSEELPQNIADAPVIWTITHHAASTEEIVSFIEANLEGVKFLCVPQRSDFGLRKCDTDLIRAAHGFCIHPLAAISDDCESNGDSFSNLPFSILGVDLQMLARSIESKDKDPMWLDLLPPANFLLWLRPWEERYTIFIGDHEIANKILDSYRYSVAEDKISDRYFDESKQGRGLSSPALASIDYHTSGVKIVDLGNACWTYKHFTDDIQTRQYRSPEVILGADYDTSADIWSAACIVFELLVGDLMFDPRAGQTWDRDEDHLAMIIELIGRFPKNVYSKGTNSSSYFVKSGDLRHISQLKFWGLKDVLFEKYKFSESDSEDIASFLLPLLEIDPARRISAYDALQHPWLNMDSADCPVPRPQSSAVDLSDQESDGGDSLEESI